MDTLYEFHKICRICLKNDLLVSIFSPTFLLRPIEMIEKLQIFKADDNLPTLLCQSCLYRLLDAYNLQQLAASSERRLREYFGASNPCNPNNYTFNLNNVNQETQNITSFLSQDANNAAVGLSKDIGYSADLNGSTTSCLYANIYDIFDHNVQSNDIEVTEVADDVLNDVEEIDVTRSEAGDTLSDVFVDGNVNSCSVDDVAGNSNCIVNTPPLSILLGIDKEQQQPQYEEKNTNKKGAFVESIANKQVMSTSTPVKQNAKILSTPDKCLDCGKVFHYKGYLEAHRRTHTGYKPFKCKLCSRHFSQSSNLILHQRTHTGERRFQCEICSNFFTTSSNLKAHKLTHSEQRNYQCSHCDRRFKSNRELKRHEPIHKITKDIICEICKKAFSKRSYLNAHMKIHAGIRRHKCNECDKIFGNKSNLVCHQRTHTGEKPYECKYCSWKFNQASALTRHLKKHFKSKSHDEIVEPHDVIVEPVDVVNQINEYLDPGVMEVNNLTNTNVVMPQNSFHLMDPTMQNINAVNDTSNINVYEQGILDFSTN